MTSHLAAVLVTGANTGLGREVARTLARVDGVERVYVSCRSEEKAYKAADNLGRIAGRQIYQPLMMDLTELRSVTAAIDGLDDFVDGIIMNAGGTGGPTPNARTTAGVTHIFAANVLGHAALLEGLMQRGAFGGTAVLVGSEAARGAPKLRIPRPIFHVGSAAEYSSVADGSFWSRGGSVMSAYAAVKHVGALYMSAMARRHPESRLLTVSPGNTAGTDVLRDMTPIVRLLMGGLLMPFVLPAFGIAHTLQTGTQRLIRGLIDDALLSGGFYASPASALTGPLTDQAKIMPDFADEARQDAAMEEIHRFLSPSPTASGV
ncbi:SDR family NAD(P)-dependent oxidoreductase [Mycobacterium simiae]|uniref:Short-chain dehydrogenase n=1 Tax=Mycobacterium simiae TaxID=1784 RepID=A0A1X0XJE4_MYCSI|nr:SDR family NAD(P)-dependent oxidoreductase [Mycobacterium simiae]ORJ52968.1 hypothetical protein B5M45_29580 [Mycobacterium simiae]